MTTAQRETIVDRVGRILDERIQLVRWHRQNACATRGIPFEDASELRIVVENPQPPATVDPPKAVPTAEEIAAAVAAKIPKPKDGAPGADGKPGPQGPPGQAASVVVQAPATASPPASANPQEQSWFAAIPDWAKAAVIAAAAGAAGVYLSGEPEKPVDGIKVVAPATSGSLLQDLEDRGFHLPETSDE